jgi:hypothetical protein
VICGTARLRPVVARVGCLSHYKLPNAADVNGHALDFAGMRLRLFEEGVHKFRIVGRSYLTLVIAQCDIPIILTAAEVHMEDSVRGPGTRQHAIDR